MSTLGKNITPSTSMDTLKYTHFMIESRHITNNERYTSFNLQVLKHTWDLNFSTSTYILNPTKTFLAQTYTPAYILNPTIYLH